jgi:hypothetical protein
MTPHAREDMSRSPMELGKEHCAIALRRAMASAGRFETIRELAETVDINYSTLRGYFQGRSLPSEENWRLLASALGQGVSTPGRPKIRKGSTSRTVEQPRSPSGDRAEAPSEDALASAEEVRRQIRHLSHTLDFFKQGSAVDRETLRRTIPGRDMGYLTSLLRALYDEDQFEAWILFSEYELGEEER